MFVRLERIITSFQMKFWRFLVAGQLVRPLTFRFCPYAFLGHVLPSLYLLLHTDRSSLVRVSLRSWHHQFYWAQRRMLNANLKPVFWSWRFLESFIDIISALCNIDGELIVVAACYWTIWTFSQRTMLQN